MRNLFFGLIIGAPLGLVLFFAWHYWDVRRGTDIDALDATFDAWLSASLKHIADCESVLPDDVIRPLKSSCAHKSPGPSEPRAPAPAPDGPGPL